MADYPSEIQARDLLGKAIFLFSHQDSDAVDAERSLDAADDLTLLRVADTETGTSEAIARLEFDWAGWADHAVQADFEGAYNLLDNTLVQTNDRGTGPVVVDVPGANTRVEEMRGDFLLRDTWSLGDFVLDYGLGAEVSMISQSGDADQERSFFYLKPRSLLTWSPSQREQTRSATAVRDIKHRWPVAGTPQRGDCLKSLTSLPIGGIP